MSVASLRNMKIGYMNSNYWWADNGNTKYDTSDYMRLLGKLFSSGAKAPTTNKGYKGYIRFYLENPDLPQGIPKYLEIHIKATRGSVPAGSRVIFSALNAFYDITEQVDSQRLPTYDTHLPYSDAKDENGNPYPSGYSIQNDEFINYRIDLTDLHLSSGLNYFVYLICDDTSCIMGDDSGSYGMKFIYYPTNTYAKVDGVYVPGATYIKVDGSWKSSLRVYRKVNGIWK